MLDSLTYPESEHNYGNNMDQTYHFSYPYAQQYTLTFSSKTAFENKWDSLYIYDGSGAQVGKYTGTELASQVITVTGDSFSLRLTSDSSTTQYGFSFDSIEATVKQPLEEMVIPATGIVLPIEYVEWTVANGSATITGYKEGLSGDLVIPAKLDGCPVVQIANDAFNSCESLESVTLPDSMTTIEAGAFKSCTSLKSITIPDSVVIIESNAFYGCPALTDVYYTGTKAQWNAILIQSGNGHLANEATHYYHHGQPHDYSIDVVITPPCTSDGVGTKRCSLCDELGEYYTIPQTGHIPGEWEIKTAPTCLEEGEEVKICTQCSEELESRAISATGHKPGEWEVKTTVTCVKDGEEVKICSQCSEEVESRAIIATGHELGEWEIVTERTATTDGKTVRYCNKCAPKNAYVLLDKSTYPESEHNYPNYADETYNFSYPGALELKLTFSSKCEFERFYDYLYIYDGSGAQIGQYSSINLASQVITIPGDSFSMRLDSDSSGTRYGFSLDRLEAKLDQPIEEIVEPAYGFEAANNSQVDFDNNIISGISAGMTSLDGFTQILLDDYSWTYEPGAHGLGTGSKAIMKKGDEVVGEYILLLYGDVDGDGWYNANDAFLVNMLTAGLITEEAISTLAYTAADANHDGTVNEFDFELISSASLLLEDIDQTATGEELATQSMFITYMSLIDQTPEVEEEPEAPQSPDVNDTTVTPEAQTEFASFIETIFSYILSILQKIFKIF